jgi:hypothetical protein
VTATTLAPQPPPVVVGLEVDHFPDKMNQVGALANYPYDVLLGSIHWIGACLFDALEWAKSQGQWLAREVNGSGTNTPAPSRT